MYLLVLSCFILLKVLLLVNPIFEKILEKFSR